MKRLLLFSLLLIIPLVSAEIVINEIMYNPDQCSDSDCEWIELYNNGDSTIDLTDWKIDNKNFDDANISAGEYLVVAKELIDGSDKDNESFEYFWGNNDGVWNSSDGNYIAVDSSFSLKNSEDLILLWDASDNIIDALHYYDDWGADGNNKSLCLIKNIWQECDSTPGQDNSDSSTSGCDWNISIILNGTVFEDPEFQVRISKIKGEGKISFTVDKWIEFSNNSISKTYNPWNGEATSKKTSSKYHPNLDEGDAYFIKANITDINCSDTDLSNNFISKMIFVPEEKVSIEQNSSIQILDSPSSAEFGDIVKVKINVYRGDTRKYAVSAYIEKDSGTDVSEKSSIHFKNKFTNYTLTIPIQLKFNCNERYKEDEYNIIIEGLGLKEKEEIKLKGKSSECLEESSEESESEQMDEIIKEITEESETEKETPAAQITGKTIYVSETSNKARNIIYLILFISVILNIIFIRASR